MADNTKQDMDIKLLIRETMACTFLLNATTGFHVWAEMAHWWGQPASLGALTQQLCGGRTWEKWSEHQRSDFRIV
jgi:hypothetical protein